MAEDQPAGLAGKTGDKGKPKPKSSSVGDITKDVEALKKVSKDLKQSNVELKEQLAQQEEWFASQLSQQSAELGAKFSQLMEVLAKHDEQPPQEIVPALTQPSVSGSQNSRKRKWDRWCDQNSSDEETFKDESDIDHDESENDCCPILFDSSQPVG